MAVLQFTEVLTENVFPVAEFLNLFYRFDVMTCSTTCLLAQGIPLVQQMFLLNVARSNKVLRLGGHRYATRGGFYWQIVSIFRRCQGWMNVFHHFISCCLAKDSVNIQGERSFSALVAIGRTLGTLLNLSAEHIPLTYCMPSLVCEN